MHTNLTEPPDYKACFFSKPYLIGRLFGRLFRHDTCIRLRKANLFENPWTKVTFCEHNKQKDLATWSIPKSVERFCGLYSHRDGERRDVNIVIIFKIFGITLHRIIQSHREYRIRCVHVCFNPLVFNILSAVKP